MFRVYTGSDDGQTVKSTLASFADDQENLARAYFRSTQENFNRADPPPYPTTILLLNDAWEILSEYHVASRRAHIKARTVIMVGKIGPAFEANSIEITKAVRQVHFDNKREQFRFLVEAHAVASDTLYFENGAQVAEMPHATTNSDVLGSLFNVMNDAW